MLFWRRKKDETPAERAGLTTLFGSEPIPAPSAPPAGVEVAEPEPEPAPLRPEPLRLDAAVPEPAALPPRPVAPPPPHVVSPAAELQPVAPAPVEAGPAPEVTAEPARRGLLSRWLGWPAPADTPAPGGSPDVAPPGQPVTNLPPVVPPVMPPAPAVVAEPPRETFLLRMKNAVRRTRQNLVGRLDTLVRGKKVISPEVLDELEEILIGADIGVRTTLDLVEKIRAQVDRKLLNDTDELKRVLRQELLALLRAPVKSVSGRAVRSELDISTDIRPYVMMVVGVNGVGKTTTIAKLAHLIKREGNDVIVCAADTFRAAAADQLTVWAERVGIPVIQQKPGTDPAAVVYDALQAAKSRDADVVIVDTAGRLHNKVNLMNELEKMSRIARREVPQAPHEVLLVLDAATGQNGLEQARQFARTVPVTGLVLTKLDGTAKGGIVVAIARELGLPIRYVGTGEQLDDLTVFSPEAFVDSLFE
ncbi:signal recognition particle-docking protein FtsY [Chloracidobacterium sp. MS 40/45]|uniref:signal recognition particle-docking protein FtsY n=1 Tax=Chloracidobacterium aggregatum TaxID=2851959 RepID=UPI001B8D9C8C|nr:signal recognition particle-docking protein FtsY [Chloracidobacterium aggregatum]QUV99082.1 signal recognition particle-docking protein FtsY [Chloracidobacterium sp. MS 40/45]